MEYKQLKNEHLETRLSQGEAPETLADEILASTTFQRAMKTAARNQGREIHAAHIPAIRTNIRPHLISWLTSRQTQNRKSKILQAAHHLIMHRMESMVEVFPQSNQPERRSIPRITLEKQNEWFDAIRDKSREAMEEATEHYLKTVRRISDEVSSKYAVDREELFAQGSLHLVEMMQSHANRQPDTPFTITLNNVIQTKLEHYAQGLTDEAKGPWEDHRLFQRLRKEKYAPPILDDIIERISAKPDLERLEKRMKKMGIEPLPHERETLHDYFHKGMTAMEIADLLRTSKTYVLATVKKATDRYRVAAGLFPATIPGSDGEKVVQAVEKLKQETAKGRQYDLTKSKVVEEIMKTSVFWNSLAEAIKENRLHGLTDEEQSRLTTHAASKLDLKIESIIKKPSVTPIHLRIQKDMTKILVTAIRQGIHK